MTQTSLLLLYLHRSCKHQNCQCWTCTSCPRRRMRSLWRWVLGGEWKPFRNTSCFQKTFLSYCCVYGSSSVEEEGRSVFPTSGAISFEYDEKTYVFYKKEQKSLSVLVVTHSHVLKHCLILHNRFEFSFLFFFLVRLKWGGNFPKVTQRSLPKNWAGSCSHQRSSVTLRLSSIRLTGSQISSPGPPPSRSMDRHHPQAWQQTTSPKTAPNFW